MKDPKHFNDLGAERLPGVLGIVMTSVQADEVRAVMEITPSHLAINGFLHAASVVALADTTCGNGCIALLPEGATGFTTLELKSNHVGTALEGVVECVATPVHRGRSTQVWDARVQVQSSGKVIAWFRCTQMILYPRA